jgi:tetratricopeptide (TPR) repeat protein
MDLAGGYEGLGDQLGKGLSDTARAVESYRQSLRQWDEAARLDPANVRARRAVAGLTMKLADHESDPKAALGSLRNALAALAGLPPAEREAVATQRLEVGLHRRAAEQLWELDDARGALDSYGRAASISSALVAADPANTRARFDLAVVLNDTGQAREASGDTAGALRDYGQVADILEKLIRTDAGNTSWRTHYAEILVRIAGLLEKTGQGSEARRQAARGLEAAKAVAETSDSAPGELTRAARLLVLCRPEALRQPEIAARYALRAVEVTNNADPYALDTLAEAYLQTGNRDAARLAIEQGLKLVPASPGGEPPWLRRLLEAKLERVNKPAP